MPEITSASVIVGDLPVSSCLLPLQFLSQHFSDVIRRFFFYVSAGRYELFNQKHNHRKIRMSSEKCRMFHCVVIRVLPIS